MKETEAKVTFGGDAENAGVETNSELEKQASSILSDAFSESDNPPEVRRRIKALKKIQVEAARMEADFFKELHDLEMKYSERYIDFYEKRKDIVLGRYEPTEDECKLECEEPEGKKETDDKDKKEEDAANANLAESMDKLDLDEKKDVLKGVPEFWLTVFQNVEMLSEMIQEYDEPILKHLSDVKVEMTTKPMGFKLFFHFSSNDYFTNTVLSKTYEMKCEVDPQDPFSFEGPEIVKCSGCKIDWKDGKNVTVRTVRKKQKHKQTGSIRMVSKEIEIPSFFDFFNPPQVEEGTDMDDETQLRLTSHFEVGQYIRERIVPRAVLYYTGEALEDESDEEEEDEYDDSDDEEETEGENEDNASQSGQSTKNEAEEIAD